MIESLFAVARQTTGRVKRWRNADQVWRWAGSGLLEAEKTFRRVKGYAAMSVSLKALGRGVDAAKVAACRVLSIPAVLHFQRRAGQAPRIGATSRWPGINAR
ncbi:MAG: hypothetical protein M1588_04550 [Planctomycetes bacterium]|nr:hypothetical protein [Planctomycetota bacterium]